MAVSVLTPVHATMPTCRVVYGVGACGARCDDVEHAVWYNVACVSVFCMGTSAVRCARGYGCGYGSGVGVVWVWCGCGVGVVWVWCGCGVGAVYMGVPAVWCGMHAQGLESERSRAGPPPLGPRVDTHRLSGCLRGHRRARGCIRRAYCIFPLRLPLRSPCFVLFL